MEEKRRRMASSSSITQIPQQQPEGEQNQDQKKKHSYLHTWACAILLALILIVIVSCLVIWFKVHPKRLRYTVENAIVRDFEISPAFNPRRNDTEERLRSTFFMLLSTYNPNHQVTLHYESIDVTVEYNGHALAFGPVEPFVQGDMGKHLFNVTVAASNVSLQSTTAEDLKKIKKSSDPIKVDVKMRARASFMVPHWVKDHRKLKIVCLGVMAHFTASITPEKTRCYIEL